MTDPRAHRYHAPTWILFVAGGFLAAAAATSAPAGPDAGVPDGARMIAVPGTSVVLKLWDARGPNGVVVPHYAISRDGAAFSAPRPTSYEILLRYDEFDPLAAAARGVEASLTAGPDTNVYIVQFLTQPIEEFRAAIRALGGTVHKFLPRHSHIVRMAPGSVEAVRALPFVRWVGPYHPAYRVEEFVLENLERAAEMIGTRRYNVMVWEAGLEQKRAVARFVEAIGGRVDRVHAGKFLLEATLDPDQLLRVLRRDEVSFVDRWGPYEADMNYARAIGGADFLENTPEGFTGDGVRGEVFDVGFNLTHVDFESRPLILHTSVVSNFHGASTSGICFGDGTGNPMGRGLLPDGQGIVSNTNNLTGQARYDQTAELLESPYFAVFQTSSVGSPRTRLYTTISAEHDTMLFDLDITHCQSQSNAGNQNSRPQAWAKNIISGGGVRHQNTLTKTDDRWGNGASTGPAADGRVKPDLTHFYDFIFTVTTGSNTSYTSNFGGTSGATPIICGHVGLFFDMWADGTFGNEVDPKGTVFENRSHMTTAKAMLINTAMQYDWTQGGPNADLTRFRQGWGMPDLQTAYERRDRMLVVDETDVLANLGRIAYAVEVPAGAGGLPLKATMTYADPAGVPGASRHRINDLTLKVTAPSGTVYWGNNGLIANLWSTPGGAPDEIDTVENVFIEQPEPGTWTVEVLANEVNEDGHVETPEIDADFALVVSGVIAGGACVADIDGDGIVGTADLLALLVAWGPCPDCREDIDDNGVVDMRDLLQVLSNWGPCS